MLAVEYPKPDDPEDLRKGLEAAKAIQRVLQSPDISRYAEIHGPKDYFNQQGQFALLNSWHTYAISTSGDKGQQEAVAKHIESRLLEEVGTRFPPDPGITEGWKPCRLPASATELQPFYCRQDIGSIPFRSDTGEGFYLSEITKNDIGFLRRMAFSSTTEGKSYNEAGIPPFLFSVLNAHVYNGDEPRIVPLGREEMHHLIGLKNIENQARKERYKATHHRSVQGFQAIDLEEFIKEKYNLRLLCKEVAEREVHSRYDAVFNELKAELDKEDIIKPEEVRKERYYIRLSKGDRIPPFISANDYLKEALKSQNDPQRDMYLLMIRDKYGYPVGVIELLPVKEVFGASAGHEAQPGEMGLGYFIAPEMNGLGLATQGSIAAIRYAKEKLGLRHLYSGADPENPASLKILFKLGFQPVREEGGEARIVPPDKVDYVDIDGHPRPRVEMQAGERALEELLADPEAVADKAEKGFSAFLKEIGRTLKEKSIRDGWVAYVDSSTSAGQRKSPP